ncbi:hypothetical protein HWV62_20940 [Athelia sp. TMB]|nr:hypothetical protein HWV62_20940 [Athelia sp. TMB]
MAYHVFNHLAGFLKYIAKNVDTPEALAAFANTVPTLARIVTQVNDMSIREIRRAKVEIFLVPSGSLWFPSSSPAGPMFPRIYGPYDNPYENAPSHLVDITMIRLSQNMLYLAMLKRNPQDVQMIRKNMSRLVLPSREDRGDTKPLKLQDFVPQKAATRRHVSSSADATLVGLSLMISRSYLLLVAQIFRSMSRHLNDRNELAVLIDGMNRIMLAHGDDIGILSQALIALMVASTRFRRLFTSGGGYTLFMPALVKIYTECDQHSGIKLAIEYAVNRFYALHQEGFIFQSLDIIAHVMMTPSGIDQSWVARSIYTLFSSLKRGVSHNTPDAAGIHDSNKLQEREALIVRTAEDKPQTFLASLRRGSEGKETVLVNLPEEYEAERLALDDFVRLFLTVIAHDPTILRGQHFLHFLRFLTPHLYNASQSARSVLRDGVDALGTVLIKSAAKAKIPESALLNSLEDMGLDIPSQDAVLENQLLGKSKTPSDFGAMRLDYLSMVIAFTSAGGQLPPSVLQKIVDIVKSMLAQSATENKGPIAHFFSEYTRTSLLRDPAPTLKEVVSFFSQLAPIVSTYATIVDFSGVFDTVTQLAEDPLYANEPTFSRLVSSQICSAALSACEAAAADKTLLSLPSRPSTIRLMSAAIFLRGADVMSELEKHQASYELLVGLILPLVMILKTTADVVSDGHWTDSWRRDVHARTWTRLLTYLMSACQKKDNARDASPGPERSRSQTQDKRRTIPSSKARMMTLVAAIQIIKIIIVRAEEDLSAHLPGIWSRIGAFLKSILADGDATFALISPDYSAPSSPVPTPRGSTSFPNISPTVSAFGETHFTHPSLSKPRVIDYCMWSMFELLCLCRTPLVIQMRLFMQEKVVILDQELRYHQSASVGRPRSRRISSGMFSKPRRRMSGYMSGLSSLENSPTLGASASFPSDPSLFSLDPSRQAGFERFASPGGTPSRPAGPRIVHLGPVNASSASAFQRSSSPSMGGAAAMNKTATIKSVSLAMETYRRIRLVQTCLGYDGLLALPRVGGDVMDDDPENAHSWSKKQAVTGLVREMKELMVEFEEPWREVEDDVVLIDADQSANF